MIRYLLDANVILRFLRDDDPEQSSQATTLFVQAAAGECVLVVPQVVLAECVWVLRSVYGLDSRVIAQVLMALISKPGVKPDEPQLAAEALALIGSANVDYVDGYLSARAAAADDVVASFDRDFRKFRDIRLWNPAGGV